MDGGGGVAGDACRAFTSGQEAPTTTRFFGADRAATAFLKVADGRMLSGFDEGPVEMWAKDLGSGGGHVVSGGGVNA